MENKTFDIPKEIKYLLIYRQNDFYDKVLETLKKELGQKAHAVVIPKETQKLNEQQYFGLLQILKNNNEELKIISDKTIYKLLDKNLRLSYTLEDRIRCMRGQEQDFDASNYKRTLTNVAKKLKDYHLKNVALILLGPYNGEICIGADIDQHGLTIENENGNKINYQQGCSKKEGEDKFKHNEEFSNEDVNQIYNFLRKPFEEQKIDVYPAVLIQNSIQGEQYKTKNKLAILKECKFQIENRNLLNLGKEISINPKESGILMDRHLDGVDFSEWGAKFYKHEGSIIEDSKTEEYIWGYKVGNQEVLKRIVEEIIQ